MKKYISLILVMILAVSCLALTSCGKKEEGTAPTADSPYIGVWKAVRGEFKDEVVPAEEIFEDYDYILDLKEDGSAVVTTDTEETGTWTVISDGVHIKTQDTDTDFKADGDNLFVEFLKFKIIFEKQ